MDQTGKSRRLDEATELLVRLAHEKGLLHRPSLNRFQDWALLYWVYMDRRVQRQDRHEQVKDETFHMFPERWMALYEDEVRAVLGMEGVQAEESKPVTDVGDLDRWFASHREKRVMNGSRIPPGMGEYWSDWQ